MPFRVLTIVVRTNRRRRRFRAPLVAGSRSGSFKFGKKAGAHNLPRDRAGRIALMFFHAPVKLFQLILRKFERAVRFVGDTFPQFFRSLHPFVRAELKKLTYQFLARHDGYLLRTVSQNCGSSATTWEAL